MKRLKNSKIPAWQRSNRALRAMYKTNALARQSMKRDLDAQLAFSADTDPVSVGTAYECSSYYSDQPNWVRLLDEGVIIECDGSIDSVIAKGVIKRWFDALPEDFEGNIDKDHVRSIDLGTFGKSQLKLVELGDGRYGVDVDVKLDTSLHATQDLIRMNNRRSISSEFYAIEGKHLRASDILGDKLEGKDYAVPLITEIALTGYGLVETPLNANSYDDMVLQRAFSATPIDVEGTEMTEEELKAKAAAEAAEAEKNAEETEAKDKVKAEDVTEGVGGDEEKVSIVNDEAENESTKGEEGAEQKDAGSDVTVEPLVECKTEEEGDDDGDEDGDDDGDEEEGEQKDASANAELTLADLEEAITGLKKELAAKNAEIADLKSKLSNTKVVQNDFQAKLAKMLNFATSTEPTTEEGKETPAKKTEEKEEDPVLKAYSAAFAEL